MGVTAVGFDYEASKEVNDQMKDDTSADGDTGPCLDATITVNETCVASQQIEDYSAAQDVTRTLYSEERC